MNCLIKRLKCISKSVTLIIFVEFMDQLIDYPINCASLSNNPKYWDRQAFANGVDTYQMQHLNRVCTVCHTCSNILDTSRGSRMDYFKF